MMKKELELDCLALEIAERLQFYSCEDLRRIRLKVMTLLRVEE